MDGVFHTTLGKPVHKGELSSSGHTSYITRTALANGVDSYGDHKNKNAGNCITIGAEGIRAFYQPDTFICGNKITILKNSAMTSYIAMFLCTILNHNNIGRFNYGYALVKKRVNQLQIKLPATPNGAPDWQFMEDYIKSLPYSVNL